MQELIKISKNEIGVQELNSANAREIHEYLEVKTVFAHWIKRAIEKYDFKENVDYVTFITDAKSGKRDYIVTVDMAKELAMLENNAKGKEVRKYFIAVEKAYKAEVVHSADLSPVLAEITKGLVEMNRTMQTIVSAMQTMQNKVSQTEIHVRYMADTQKDIRDVMKSTYNYLKYMPLTREERIKLNERIQRRGKELSDIHGITLEVAIASIYRALNKAYSLSSYHELDRKDFLSAYDFVDYVNIGKGSEYYRSDIQDPLEEKYGVDVSERSRGKNIYGDYVDRDF